MSIPSDLRFTKSHEWIRVEGDEWVVGITDFAQKQLGDLTFVELPGEGDAVEAESDIVVVESVKAASDVYAVASGEITGANDGLEMSPELINSDPYGEGWIYRIKPADASLDGFLTAEQYGEIAPDA